MRAIPMAFLLLFCLPATATQYIRLDGRYYTVTSDQPLFDPILSALIVTGAQMTNCGRSNGQAMVFGSFTLYYGPSAYMVPLVSTDFIIARPDSTTTILQLASTTGDFVCLGQVADPTQTTPLFASSFE